MSDADNDGKKKAKKKRDIKADKKQSHDEHSLN